MIELKGKFNHAKIFTENIESEAIAQILSLLNYEAYRESQIRIMPDVHAGKGCTIGTTMTIHDKITPNLVGVDIGCGMLTTKLSPKTLDLEAFDRIVREYIPSGFDVRDEISEEALAFESRIRELRMLKRQPKADITRFLKSVGTLGGGNHFIAIERSEDDVNYLIIHSGSRSLGLTVANYYQELAIKHLEEKLFDFEGKKRALIEELKRNGRQREIPKALEALVKSKPVLRQIDKDLAYLEGEEMENYLHDVRICQEYASLNRKVMTRILLEKAKIHPSTQFETVHNYIDLDEMILRKGAISARDREVVLIPLNMRDGSLIAVGKGNPDWNYSAPHGAGRILSRRMARETIDLEAFKESMVGIYSNSVNESTLDESPFAYKPYQEIIENVKDSVDIVRHLKPIYNYKDGAAK